MQYARQLFKELDNEPLDRQLLDRFAAEVANRGDVCDIGCGPGQVARHLRDAGTAVFGVDISPKMAEVARRLNPDISFREGNVLALDTSDATLEGIVAFYAIVNIPKQLLPVTFYEMRRVAKPLGAVVAHSFHVGNETLPAANYGIDRYRWHGFSFQ